VGSFRQGAAAVPEWYRCVSTAGRGGLTLVLTLGTTSLRGGQMQGRQWQFWGKGCMHGGGGERGEGDVIALRVVAVYLFVLIICNHN
jgi:hypothetical protein